MQQLSTALIVILVFLFSCSSKEENMGSGQSNTSAIDSIPPLQITLLADLPDSLQPKTIALDQVPPPLKVFIPTTKGRSYTNSMTGEKIKLAPPVKKMLPTLKNEAGQTVFDRKGNPFILGDGGISNFTIYTPDDGLGFGQVNRSYLDQSGNLWFGTRNGGVSRFDPSAGSGQVSTVSLGTKFTVYTTAQGLAGNTVWSITQDRAGHLWFGTLYSGVSRFDGHSFTRYTTAQGLAGNDVRKILEDQRGHLWFGTYNGVSRYDPSTSLGTSGSDFTTYTTAHGLASNEVRHILEDQRGYLWFSTNRGVSRYDPDRDSFATYTTAQGLAGNSARDIFEDQKGNIWFNTDSGVSRYDPSASSGQVPSAGSGQVPSASSGQLRFTTYTTAQGLASNDVRVIFEDRRGHLWFGTRDRGVSQYDPDKEGALPTRPDGTLVAIGGQASFKTYDISYGLASNDVRDIFEDQRGHLWFGTVNGVSRLDPSASSGQVPSTLPGTDGSLPDLT